MIAQASGKRGADVRPDLGWNKKPVAMMGYRWNEFARSGHVTKLMWRQSIN